VLVDDEEVIVRTYHLAVMHYLEISSFQQALAEPTIHVCKQDKIGEFEVGYVCAKSVFGDFHIRLIAPLGRAVK